MRRCEVWAKCILKGPECWRITLGYANSARGIGFSSGRKAGMKCDWCILHGPWVIFALQEAMKEKEVVKAQKRKRSGMEHRKKHATTQLYMKYWKRITHPISNMPKSCHVIERMVIFYQISAEVPDTDISRQLAQQITRKRIKFTPKLDEIAPKLWQLWTRNMVVKHLLIQLALPMVLRDLELVGFHLALHGHSPNESKWRFLIGQILGG